MKTFLLMTLAIVFSLICAACIEHELTVPDSLAGVVLDAETQLPIERVKISIEIINKGVGVLGPQGTVERRVWLEKSTTTDRLGRFSIDVSDWKHEIGDTTIQGLTISDLKIQKEGYVDTAIKYPHQATILLRKKG